MTESRIGRCIAERDRIEEFNGKKVRITENMRTNGQKGDIVLYQLTGRK